MKKMSRKVLAVVLCAAMLVGYFTVIPHTVTAVDTVASTSTTPVNPNLLDGLNPDFETTNDLKGWTVSDKTAVFQSNTIVTEGKVSLCIKDTSATAKQNAVSDQTTVIAGEPYYAIAKTFGTTHGVLTVHFYDANGAELADKAVSQSVAVAKQEWQALNIQVDAPEGAVKAAVEISTTVEGVGVAYFDNVAFYAEPGDTNTLNSSFEGGFDAGECLPEGWRGWGGKTPMRQINTNLNYVHKGKQSMKLGVNINPATNKNATTGIESNFVDVIPGLPYVYSFWHKSEPYAEGQSISYVYVNFYNIDGQRINTSGQPVANSSTYSYSKQFNSVNSWTKQTDVLSAPVGAAKAELWILTCSATKVPIYLDEVTFKRDKSVPVLPNPSFEEGFNASNLPNGWSLYSTGGASFMETEIKTDGDYALKIDNTVIQNYTGVVVWLPAITGEIWKLNFDMKGTGQVYLTYFTADKKNQLTSAYYNSSASVDSDWVHKELQLEATATQNGKPGLLRVLITVSKTAQGVGYFDNFKLERIFAPEVPNYSNLLNNAGFEDREGVPGWPRLGFTYMQTDEYAGGDRGNFVLKLTDDNKSGATQFTTDRVPVTPGEYYHALVDCTSNAQLQLYIRFYDANGKKVVPTTFNKYNETNQDLIGEWTRMGVLSRAPETAVTMEMLFGTTLASVGTAYVDNIYLGVYDKEKDADIPGMNSVKSPGWDKVDFNEVGHPRSYFTKDELKELKKSVSFGIENELGYSIRESYKELLEDAETYLAETYFRASWVSGGPNIYYDLIEFKDFNTIEELWVAPPGYPYTYPYFSNFAMALRDRMHTLAVAYALSGDKAYGERAVHYAMKLCEWEIWSQKQVVGVSATSDMGCSYVTDAAGIVYDLCYDLLTDAQRKTLYTNIAEKGLKALIGDIEANINHNTNLNKVNGVLVAASCIAEEDNRDLVEPYLTAGYRYAEWFLDELYESGWQEGFSYTHHGLEAIIKGVDMLSRATQVEAFWGHPYFEEILVPWVTYASLPGSGVLPSISDSSWDHYFFVTLMMINKNLGNTTAGFYLKNSGILQNASAMERVLYANPNPVIAEEWEVQQTAVTVDKIGYGFLRSGFGALDVALTMIANDSQHGHNHWDQNSIVVSFNSTAMVTDFGYASIGGSEDAPGYAFGYYDGHSTIFVDGKAQDVKGTGVMTNVLNNPLYGHLMGSAADAYGGRLTQADRHSILLNHIDKPYYIIIDELNSDSEHVYNWNLYTNGWNGLQFDQNVIRDKEATKDGHQVVVMKDRDAAFLDFVGHAPFEMTAFEYRESFPVIQINSPSAQKYQFMTVISMDKDVSDDAVISFNPLIRGFLYGMTNKPSDKVVWSTHYDGLSEVIKKVTVSGNDCVFFRAQEIGDWIEMPFEVETTGTYEVKLNMPQSPNYGDYKIYLDGEAIPTIFRGYNTNVRMTNFVIGLREVTAGHHVLRLELVDFDSRSTKEGLISCGGVILADPNKPAASSTVKITETYDDASVLGATIRYGLVLDDVVLYNRSNGTITGGKTVTDGAQAAVMGIYGNEVTEGFSITKGTSLKFGETVLMNANGKITMAVDYRGAKFPIQNTEVPIILPEEEEPDRTIPTTVVSTNADATRFVSINVGNDTPYSVVIDGKTATSVYEDGMISFDVPAGKHSIKIIGKHTCVYDQRAEAIANMKAAATCTQGAQYYVSCLCGANGDEVFTAGEGRGHKWNTKGTVTVEATCLQAGEMTIKCRSCSETMTKVIEKLPHTLVASGSNWDCTECGKRFADAEGTIEIAKTDVTMIIIIVAAAVVVVGGGAAAFLVIKKKKQKK